MTSEHGTHSGFWDVTSKFTSHAMRKPQNQKKQYSFHCESLQSRLLIFIIHLSPQEVSVIG